MFQFDQEALNELILEFLVENKNRLFDLTVTGETEVCFSYNPATGGYTCAAYNHGESRKIDFDAMEAKKLDIAKTLFGSRKIYTEQAIEYKK